MISVHRGFVYVYRPAASVWKMPMGAASVSSRSRSAEIWTWRARFARSSALMKRLANTETLARSSSGGTGANMKSTAPSA